MTSRESLWEFAVRESLEQLKTSNSSSGEKTLLLAGSKGSGKTTIIQRFLDRSEPAKETLAMEYTFGRKSGRSLVKDICHIWELGGGTLFSHLLTTPLGKAKKDITLVLVLDLSSPNTLWHTLESLLQQVYNHYKKIEDPEVAGQIDAEARSRIDEAHEDFKFITPFPIPLVIVGAKYDVFQNHDPENKKMVCRTLRQVAHSLAASLVFYSDKDSTLVKKLKDVFNYHGFGGSPWKGYVTDHNKPLSIACGADSFDQIGVNSSSYSAKSHGLSLERYKHTYTTHFPQEAGLEKMDVADDPAKDPNFREPIIDVLRSQKDEELDRYCREMENRRRIAAKV